MAEADTADFARHAGALDDVLGAAALQMADMRAAGDRVQDLVSTLVALPGAGLDREIIVGLQGLDSLVQRLALLAELLGELEFASAGAVIADPARREAVRAILVRLEGAALRPCAGGADHDDDPIWTSDPVC